MKVLLIEDEAKDRELIISFLNKMDDITFVTAETMAVTKSKLNVDTFDLLLLNLDLPNGEGMSLFRRVVCLTPVPILILAAADDEEVALEAGQEGAYGYILKENLTKSKLYRHMHYAHKQFKARAALIHENVDLRKTTKSAIERMQNDSRLEKTVDRNFGTLFGKMDDQGQRIASVETAQKSMESAVFKIPERVATLETKISQSKHCTQIETITTMNTKMKLLFWLLGTLVFSLIGYVVSHIDWTTIFGVRD